MRTTTSALALGIFISAGCLANDLGNVASENSGGIETTVAKEPFDADFRAACGEGGLTIAGEQSFLRWPYLQKMTDDGVEILWTTPPSTEAASVRVTTPDGELVALVDSSVDSQSQRAEHTQYTTTIEGLEPNTLYCYEVAGTDGWLSRTGFRTAPLADDPTPIRIAVIGDLGTQTTDQYAVLDELMNVKMDLVLVVGDLAYESGTLADHENNFFRVYREMLLSVPFFVISGNHDYAQDGAVFREVFALFENGGPDGRERWYSFDWGRVHFTAVDTEVLNATQEAWVRADIAKSDARFKIAFLHKPPFSSGAHGSNTAVQSRFTSAFAEGGVDLVLAGHDHNYERTEAIDGVTYVVTGSAGRGTRPVGSSSFTEYSESVAHFTFLDVGMTDLRLNAIDATGGDFDTVVIPASL